MTPTIDNTLGRHEARLDGLDNELSDVRKQQAESRSDVQGLKNWIMGTLAAALGGTLMQIIVLATRR